MCLEDLVNELFAEICDGLQIAFLFSACEVAADSGRDTAHFDPVGDVLEADATPMCTVCSELSAVPLRLFEKHERPAVGGARRTHPVLTSWLFWQFC